MTITFVLPRVQTAKIWDSLGPTESEQAARLQELFDKGMTQQYETEKTALEQKGFQFRLTDGRVFQIIDKGRMIQVPIKFQVKLGTITWYFDARKDETHQDFRDEVYRSAALAHKKVDNHCEKYWRGTNSLHVKKMHTRESEADFNHNHYRMSDVVDVDPKAVYQHLMGFVEAQRALNLLVDGKEKFLTQEEALGMTERFNMHWIRMTHVGPARTVKMGDATIELSERHEAILTHYKRTQEERLTSEDKQEWAENKHTELPCITIVDWDVLNIPERLRAITKGMRGIGSELALTRQMDGSKNATVSSVVKKDDQVKILHAG